MMLNVLVLIFSLSTAFTAGHRVDKMVRVRRQDIDMAQYPKPEMCNAVAMDDRIECTAPELYLSDGACKHVGCCMNGSFTDRPHLCFFPRDYQRYVFYLSGTNVDDFIETELNASLWLKFPGRAGNEHFLELSATYPSRDVAHVVVDVSRDPRDHNVTWVPPVPVLSPGEAYIDRIYNVELVNDGRFTITRKAEGGDVTKEVPIFKTDFSLVTYHKQHIQITLLLPSRHVYGLGERLTPLQLPMEGFYLYNQGVGPNHDRKGIGSHPMYICLEDGGTAHGVYLHNSNPMEAIVSQNPAVAFRAYGGKLDFYVFAGPTIHDVIRQYLDLVGRPAMPPYWGLGYHLSSSGYKSITNVENVLKRNVAQDIFVEAMWNDIEYFKDMFAFTLSDSFEGIRAFLENLHKGNRHYVMNFPPFVRKPLNDTKSYKPYSQGVHMDIFVKNVSTGLSRCKIANNYVVYVDFTSEKALDYWGSLLAEFHVRTQFDGVWLTHTSPWCDRVDPVECLRYSHLEILPNYPPREEPHYNTLCMEDVFKISNHYNVHNMYPYYAAMVTYKAMEQKFGKRPFVMVSSTFAGQGKWSGHWTGESRATWESMRESIPMLLTLNLQGMPFVGADICGTTGDTAVELCSRWHALGGFYPFARNHNGKDFIDQDPAALGPKVVGAAKRSILRRYQLLPYLYTLFYRHTVHAEPVMRPLFYEFPQDENTYAIDTQFMWGPAILVCPILYSRMKTISAYIPLGIWYDFYNGTTMLVNKGQNKTIRVSSLDIVLYIRGGYIIPKQLPAKTIHESRTGKFELIVAPDDIGEANGELYWDDGISPNTFEKGKYTLYEFKVLYDRLVVKIVKSGYNTKLRLANIRVLGIQMDPRAVYLNDKPVTYAYDTDHKVLRITVDLIMDKHFTVSWKLT
ncbi:lysosomal alpha-glucosidase-like [Ornithodoros turicata]|uniref:lysosomal alpha-glucosidase-like n=1 Tax=Ornithodoros turicata TaxID=34597 RepID=UPI003138C461